MTQKRETRNEINVGLKKKLEDLFTKCDKKRGVIQMTWTRRLLTSDNIKLEKT